MGQSTDLTHAFSKQHSEKAELVCNFTSIFSITEKALPDPFPKRNLKRKPISKSGEHTKNQVRASNKSKPSTPGKEQLKTRKAVRQKLEAVGGMGLTRPGGGKGWAMANEITRAFAL